MAQKRGIDLLVEINVGTAETPDWDAFAGMRARSVRVGRTVIDTTTADAAELHRVLLSGGGVFSADISVSGVFDAGATQEAAMDAAETGTFLPLRITFPDVKTYVGNFAIDGLTLAGPHDAEMTFDATLMSAGEITIADVA